MITSIIISCLITCLQACVIKLSTQIINLVSSLFITFGDIIPVSVIDFTIITVTDPIQNTNVISMFDTQISLPSTAQRNVTIELE